MRKLMSKTYNSKLRDPFIFKHNGMYYHCFTKDSLVISISKADTLEGLETAEEHVVFIPDKPEYSKQVWAPELHIIDNKCYIYFVADRNHLDLYSFDGAKVRKECNIIYNGKIYCYDVPYAWLTNEGALPKELEEVRNREYEKFKSYLAKNKKAKDN